MDEVSVMADVRMEKKLEVTFKLDVKVELGNLDNLPLESAKCQEEYSRRLKHKASL